MTEHPNLMKGNFIMTKKNVNSIEAFIEKDMIDGSEGSADQLALDGTTGGRETIATARTATDESDSVTIRQDKSQAVAVPELESTQSEESVVTVSTSKATLNRWNYYMTGSNADRDELEHYLIATEQRLRITTELGGIFDGSGPGIPCPSCGYDDSTWLRDKFGNYLCRRCIANGKYYVFSWIAKHQGVSFYEALVMSAEKSGYAFRLYRLHDVLQNEAVIIVRGEKTADCLMQVLRAAETPGTAATTSPSGTSDVSFWEGFVQHCPTIASKKIIIIPDHNETGMDYARTAARVLMGANPKEYVKIVELNDRPLPEGGNFADWFASLTEEGKEPPTVIEALVALCNGTEPLTSDIIETWSQAAG